MANTEEKARRHKENSVYAFKHGLDRLLTPEEVARDYRHISDIEAVPTDKLCYECGQRLFKYEDRLQCLGQGCGAWEPLNLPTTKGQEDARTN
jgi:hypothetical protein